MRTEPVKDRVIDRFLRRRYRRVRPNRECQISIPRAPEVAIAVGSKEILDQYLEALDLKPQRADFAFLREIVQRHVARLAFCSVGPRLGDALPLDVASLHDRIVVRRRGGYCFEHNGLLYEMLEALGFEVTLYLARVIYNRDIQPGLTHRITLVHLDAERYLVDVGFGPLGPDLPVGLSQASVARGGRVFRVAEPRAGEFHLQTLKDGAFFSLYRFELASYGQADCELGHFYSHRHPAAVFVNNLVASRILDGEIRSLRNREYWVITPTGEQRRTISDGAGLQRLLATQFDIEISAEESLLLFQQEP
ncbi:arylamine N-acetyltransferase [Hyphomonas sp.]|uniref:arylamine N-acetyltransferase family protein n=1 Tax=Hyphomonas sp. TaxID=87 RepID=UPI0033407D58